MTLVCDGCTKCCEGVHVFLQEGEDASQYETVADTSAIKTGLRLKTVDGKCIYLGNGCTIYERRPKTCRAFDCRAQFSVFLELTHDERRKAEAIGMFGLDILNEGAKRFATLSGERADLRTDERASVISP